MGRRVVLAVFVLAGLVLSASVAHATGSGNDRQGQLEQQIGVESQAEIAALSSLRAIQDKRSVLDAQVAALDQRLAATERTLAPLQAEADRLARVVQGVEAEVTATQASLDAARQAFNQSAADEYRSARQDAQYTALASSSPDDLVYARKFLDVVSASRDDAVRRLAQVRADLEGQRRAAHADQAKADAAAATARTARDQVAALRAQVEPARAAAAQEQAAEQATLADIQTRLGSDEAELAALVQASDSISALLRQHPTPGHPGGCDARPVPGPITSGFGPRRDPIRGTSGFHPGVDMNASYGDPIFACRAGTVVVASWQGGYGNATVIDHGGGMATLYGHQSRLAVTVGQHVNAGQIIGYIGSTGYSTGPHLHFEVRLDGNPVNPAPYL
jgi:murein DD-endopeptidase MepM/ murein hydrolase activator NlpD